MNAHQAMLSVKAAGGSGLAFPIGTIHGVRPHKRPGKAILTVLWTAKHGPGKVGRRLDARHVAFDVLADPAKLERRIAALRSAG